MSDLWVTITEADAYMVTRHGAAAKWPSVKATKTAVLTTAQADIEAAEHYTFLDGDLEDLTEDPTDPMKAAVFEQALFRLLDPDMEVRAAIQRQGVTSSTPVGEAYAGLGGAIPICYLAACRIEEYRTGSIHSGSFPVER